MITAGTYGAPNWVDLATPDIEEATKFYGELFGWEFEKSRTPMGDYFIAKRLGREIAGLIEQRSGMGDMALWTIFFNVEDIDMTLATIAGVGGEVLQPAFDVPDGKVGVAADPTGAMFGLFSGPKIDAVWLAQDQGAVSWVETLTRDPAASEGFYSAVFDWKAETSDAEGTRYTTFSLDEDTVAGMMMMPDSVPADAPSHWSVYFAVDDCEPAVRRLIRLGGKPLMPIMDLEMGRFVVAEDPQGAVFQLMEYTA